MMRDTCDVMPVSVYSQDPAVGRIGENECRPFCGNHIVNSQLLDSKQSQATYRIHCPYQLCQDMLIYISGRSILTDDKSVRIRRVKQFYQKDTYIQL